MTHRGSISWAGAALSITMALAATSTLTLHSTAAHADPSRPVTGPSTTGHTETASALLRASGKVRVDVRTPRGVPASVTVRRGTTKRVVAKKATGSKHRSVLRLKTGRLSVAAPDIVFGAVTYRAKVTRSSTQVRKGRTTKVSVRYRKVTMAQQVRVKRLSATTVELTWSKPGRGQKVVVRRTAGEKAAATPRAGTGVKVNTKTRTARTTGLTSGKLYSFTVFTVKNRTTKGRTKGQSVVGKQTLKVAPFDLSTDGGWVAPSTSMVFQNPRTAPKVTVRGSTISMALGQRTTTVGSGVVLPPSTALPAGFLGRVSDISADGRFATLVSGSLDDVYTSVFVRTTLDDFSVVNAGADVASPTFLAPAGGRGSGAVGAASTLRRCATVQGTSVPYVSAEATMDPTGTFETGLFGPEVLGKTIPTGLWVKSSFDLRPKATFTAKGSGSVACGLELTRYAKTKFVGYVPLAVTVNPAVEVALDGKVDIDDAGVQGSLGARMDAEFRLPATASVTPGLITDAQPIGEVNTLEGNFRASIAADVVVGFGAADKSIGAMAGVNMRVSLLDFTLGPKWPMGDSRHLKCITGRLTSKVEFSLDARAWIKKVEFKKAADPFFSPTHVWWEPHFPSGCESLATPTDDVIGDDVDVVEDDVEGDPSQWGRDDVFSPGSPSWILSTGLMSQLRGNSSFLASTNLGQAGNPRLSALVDGLETHDAVAYRTTVVPKHDTLHVRYLFASEEYPEYVGSQFNDVMAVYVDGVNCATIDGSPVSVNAINADRNSHLFVNNWFGDVPGPEDDGGEGTPQEEGPELPPAAQMQESAGLDTTMDGFTKPLQCDVAVIPGKPVQIEIAVADTSDGILDSAVALLDKGIWSS